MSIELNAVNEPDYKETKRAIYILEKMEKHFKKLRKEFTVFERNVVVFKIARFLFMDTACAFDEEGYIDIKKTRENFSILLESLKGQHEAWLDDYEEVQNESKKI